MVQYLVRFTTAGAILRAQNKAITREVSRLAVPGGPKHPKKENLPKTKTLIPYPCIETKSPHDLSYLDQLGLQPVL